MRISAWISDVCSSDLASSFGLDLLLGPAVVLVLLAVAQMFVVGGSGVDLGVGAFAGLVNVLSATLLVSHPVLGAGAIAAGLVGYAVLGALIQRPDERRVGKEGVRKCRLGWAPE